MIVCGLNFGDEGKGLTTSFLCSITKNPLVVRFNGGHQAGHTVVYNGKHHVFSSLGSGTLQGVPTYWSKYCTFYPTAFVNEIKLLDAFAFFINPLCPVVTPYDLQYNQKTAKENNHGSVGVGFGATIQRQENNFNLFVQDLFYPKVLKAKLENIRQYYDSSIDISNFLCDIDEVKNMITLCDDKIINNYNPIFEGAQGILLDQKFGFFPNVTRSNTTSQNALELYPSKEIYYVTRSYLTRHGNGYLPDEFHIDLKNNKLETNKTHEYQGYFRTARLNTELMNYSLQCDHYFSHGLKKNLVITCIDQLNIDIEKVVCELKLKFNNIYTSSGNSFNNIIRIKTTNG